MPMSTVHRTTYEELYRACAWLPLPQSTFVRLTGQDAKGWLQGQVSQDLRDLVPGDSAEACLLKPTGQIEAIVTVYLVEGGAVIATSDPEPIAERIRRFVVMEDVALSPSVSECASLQGPESSARLGKLVGSTASNVVAGDLGGIPVQAFRAPRTGPGGWDLVYPQGTADAVRKALDDPPVGDVELLQLAMLEIGSPVPGLDITKKTLPPELGPHFEDRYVSYKKGCYNGQEVMARLKARGHTNLTWVRLTSEAALAPCTSLTAPDGSEAGTVTRFAVSPQQGTIGAAWVRNRWALRGTALRAEGTAVTVTAWPAPG